MWDPSFGGSCDVARQHDINSVGMPMLGKFVGGPQPIAHALADGTFSFERVGLSSTGAQA